MRLFVLTAAVVLGLLVAPQALAAPSPVCTGSATVTCTFAYTDQVTAGPYVWTVPAGVTRVTFDLYGAQGGGTLGTGYTEPHSRGRGAHVRATVDVAALGQTTFSVRVGQQGSQPGSGVPTSAFNGGGAGGTTSGPAITLPNGGGGGGASDIRAGGDALANRILVAGGGGGWPGNNFGLGGDSGSAPVNGGSITAGGGGGTQSAGGAGYTATWSCSTPSPSDAPGSPGANGVLGAGGDGGLGGNWGGGGGGGGYWGGGGGSGGHYCGSSTGLTGTGGGGGSSHIAMVAGVDVPGANLDEGAREGDGLVTVTYTIPVNSAADPGDGTCTVSDCTLREAIAAAGSGDTIEFAIPGGGVKTILLNDALPTFFGALLDGWSQGGPSYTGPPLIEIDGSGIANGNGLEVGGDDATVRGLAIGGFTGYGIYVDAAYVSLFGNHVGTDAAGMAARPNAQGGVYVNDNEGAVIGGPGDGEGNVVSGNGGHGIELAPAFGYTIQGNLIGVGADGTTPLGNSGAGVFAESCCSVDGAVGGAGPGEPNVIAFNGSPGIVMASSIGAMSISVNSIHDNDNTGTGLGIDLGNDGVTANDPGDTDSGPNGLQNFPVITSAVQSGGTLTVAGSFDSDDSHAYNLNFYVSSACDASGNGEGATYVGRLSEAGVGSFNAVFASTAGSPSVVTATATGNDGTSEFSACTTITAAVPPTGTVTLAPVADTFVAAGAPTTNFGSLDYADVYGGANPSCVLANGTSYTLMRFDLSSIPAGATITDARLEATTRAGWAQDGDPAHWALFIPDDTWGESTVTWNTRPTDGPTTVGGTAYSGGPDIRQSPLSFGAADVWRNGCGQDPDPAGNQTKVFPSSTDGMPRTVAEARAGLIAQIATQRAGDGKLSLELWAPNCPVCTVGNNLAYWGRYYTREAANPALRPKLVVTYGSVVVPAAVTNLTISGPASADAGAPAVPLLNIPPGALVVPQTSGTQAAPVNQSPVNQSPVNQLPVNQLPVNQSPVNQSPVNQLPVNQSPVNQSGLGLSFAALAQAPGPLGDTALSTIPLLRPGGWGAILPAPVSATPLQSVTLRQVFSLSPLPAPLQPGASNPIRFADIDFSKSPLGSLPAMTLALGQLPVSGISGVDWCALFSGPPLNCSGSLPPGTSLLSAALEGAPVNQSPVNQSPVDHSLIDALAAAQAPVNQLPVNQLPVNQLPVNQLPVNQSRILSFPVNQLPVNQSPVNQSPVNQLSLNAILAANAPVSQSPVNQLPVNQLPVNQSVVNCTGSFNCADGTLGQAYAAGAIIAETTLGDLRRALAPSDLPDDWTIANLEYFADLIVGDLLESLPQPNDLTLADVLALALFANNPESFAFETLNIFDTSLSLYAAPPGTTPYSVAFTLDPNGGATGGPSTVALSVTLPRTFAYAPGTSKLVTGSGCGSGTAVTDPTLTQVASGVTKATWSVSGVVGSSYTLCFTARPGIVLGPQSATAAATPAGGATVSAASPEPVTVVDASEAGNNTPGSSPFLTTSKLYLSYLTSAADVDYYGVDVPAVGSRTTFHLSHLPADYDLVIYGPEQTALRAASPSTPPLDGAPLTDTGSELTHVTDALPSQTLDDLRLQTLPVVGVSASRGTDPEDITVLSDGSGGSYTVQVTSYNGATSPDPYMLRVTSEAPRVDVTTPSRSVSGTAANTVVGALPTGFNTLFLVNQKRLEAGATSVLGAITANQASFSSLGFPNTVLFVDAYPAVQAAYANWDADPGDPDLANKVVAAINAVVDSEVRAKPNGAGLKYLVIVGGDRVIPQGRLGDFTTVANESGYAETFDRTSDLFATLHAGQMLSDDPYGTLEPVPYLNRQLYVPRLSVGRLVETPEEIVATLNRFTAFSGRLDPATSLVTGYDFMRDGAAAINAQFAGRLGAGAVTLPSPILTGPEDWTRATLLGAFLPAAGAPAITSLNGHADHFQFAPPSPLPPFFTTADLPLGPTQAPAGNTGRLANRLVFSMGCHGGMSVSDAVVTGNTFDWPQAYSRNGVGAYLGNTGYGYGDSLVVAYSELLDSIFAKKIAAGATVGNALAAAKQEYFGSLGVFGVYDEKAMAEFTLYGLPMWSVTTPDGGAAPASATPAPAAQSGGVQVLSLQATAAVPTSTSIVTDTATGLQAEAFTLDAIANSETSTTLGRYWSGPDGVQATHFRPLQPKAFVDVAGTSGHGALITELHQQADIPGVDPVFARPIVDTEDTEPELSFGDVAFPARLQALRTFTRDGVPAQRVVLMTGQFFTGASPGVNGQGVQRLYTRIGARVLRSSSNDFTPPAFTRIEATKVAGSAAFSLDVTDLGGAAQVKRVLVALRSGSDPIWKFSDLGQAGTSSTWSGGVPLTDAADEFEYFVQAVDAAGNVGVSTNKGFFFAAAAPPAPTGNVTVAPAAPVPPSGWFAGPTAVEANGPAGVTLEVSVDGGPFTPVPQGGGPTVSGDGVHTVEARGSNGGTAGTVVAIDAGDPEITIATPAPGASYRKGSSPTADFTCADTGSGVASCTGTIASGAPISTATTGTKTFTVNATDNVGKTATKSVTYTVFEPCALPAPAGAIVRGSGNDTINGTPGNDVIYDSGGNNKIDGKGGNDIICSGTGNDTITTGGGDDIVIDTGGNNTVNTGGGNDEISTRTGNDKITAGAGNDIVTDTGGNTTIDAGSGDDDVTSGTGNDNISTGAGNDVVSDAGGNNTIDTGAGNDEVSTRTGNDKITAGDGDDVIADTGGNNTIDLGGGIDTVTTATGNDTIEGGADDDTIDAGNGDNNVNGGSGNDRITTGSGNDRIDGGPGYDVCKPGSGNNSVTNCEV